MSEGAPRGRSWVWVLLACAAVAVLAGAGVATYLASQDDDQSTIITSDQPDDERDEGAEPGLDQPAENDGREDASGAGGDSPNPDGSARSEPPSGDQPADDAEPTGSFDFSDELLEQAIAEGESNPLEGLPGRDSIASERLVEELSTAGFDLTGLGVTVYPASSTSAFALLETDDSSVLVNDDDGGEQFVLSLLESPVIADAEVERLILRHSSVDDEGPFVLTFTVPLSDIRAAAGTGADAFESIAVQVERP